MLIYRLGWIAGLVAAVGGVADAARPTAGSVTAERLKLPSGPSSVRGLAGEPEVDPFFAQVNYQVPIELPAGLGGLSPTLALTYSGALGNGPMGIGWTLSSARIQRSMRLGVPKYDDTDELEISGIVSGRLVSIGNGEYRVEGMGQTVRVRRVGDGFEVDSGTGLHYKLGATPAGRQARDATHTLAWLVEEQTNQMGERVRYDYINNLGQVYLAKLTWGPGDVYSAQLAYEARGDKTTSFREGFAVVTAQRLTSIRVRAFGVERRAYQLAYDATFPVARLAGVTSTGVSGNGAWPALSFKYAAPAAPVVTPVAGIGAWRLNSNGTTLVDLDGDGAADLLQLADGGHSYLANQNGTFGAAQSLTGNATAITAVQLQDIDGDARAELLQDTGNGWAVWKFAKTQWVPQSLPGGVWPGSQGLALKQPSTTRFADLDGNGLSDAIQWDNDNLKIHLASRTGIAAAYEVPRIGGAVLPTALGRFQDVNGDGLDDYVVINPDRVDEYIGHGDGTFEPVHAVAYPFAGAVATPDDVELADLDRDGLMDLIKVDLGQVRWFRGRPDGTFVTTAVTVASPETHSATVVVAVADINGNGSQDVVWSSVSGMWQLDMAGTTSAGMLVEVQNGLGMDVTFAYRSAHSLSVDARQAGVPWASDVPIAMPVPVGKTTALGAGETTRQVSYAVRDAFWDALEQRFGGFLTTSVTTAGATLAQTGTVITRYNSGTSTNRELRGRPLTVQVKDGTGRRLSLTTNTWEAMPVAGLPDVPLLRRAVLREARTRHEDTTPVRETDATYDYDAFGRQKHAVDQGRLDITGDESVRDTTYADDDTTWIRDQLCEEKVSSTAGVIVSDTQYLFGDNATILPLCAVGKGWERATQALLASESRFVTGKSATYDVHGNPVSLTENGVTRRMVYDTNGLFPLEEHLTAPSRELVWTATWDSVLGAVSSVTDPNGHISRMSYDSLGRLASTAIDGHAPHQIIEYDLTPPFPKTTTWDYDGPLADVATKPAAWSAINHWRQRVEVVNGKGEVRYRATRTATDQWIIADYQERDPNSRVVFSGRPVYSAQLQLTARPAGIAGDQLAYDPLGRLITQTLPTGATRTYRYVAFERTVQEPELAPVHSVIDGQGRAILTERSLPDGTHEIVQATYDAAGRLTGMTLAGAAVQRTFAYDTLGRLIQSSDPDLGVRTLRWDDGGRLTEEHNAAGQTIRYSYDALGRLATRDAGAIFTYHYDNARAGAGASVVNTAGRLASIDEPTGGLDVGYDELGRTTFTRHRIDSRTAEETTAFTASGLVLSRGYDDGFAVPYSYDPAGRLTRVGDLWQVVDQDAAGESLHELAQNGVDTRYVRDSLGLASKVTLRDATGAAIYDVTATRNPWTGITALTDSDAAGLDHSAQFGYDGFARLTSASTAGFAFGYRYDVLHNMTSRTVTGPHALPSVLAGTYRYAEGGHAPRQLTSIADAAGKVAHTFNYDPAGRQIAKDGLRLSFDPMDRLLRVDGIAGGPVQHIYGQSGDRLKTVAGGVVTYLFSAGDAERNGVREHDVTVGSRVIARITMAPAAAAAGETALGVVSHGRWGFALAALGLVLVGATRRTPGTRRIRAAGMAGLVTVAGCAPLELGDRVQSVASLQHKTFLHTGFGVGPVVFTDDTGRVLEERRYEPFGAPIDARVKSGSGYTVGAPDLIDRDLNPLNKRTDVATGWSDHGARWLAPETGRWLTPDPPVEGPSAKLMLAPWALHPYQYVDQNPIAYWDPDGREPKVDSSVHVIAGTTIDALVLTGGGTIDLVNGRHYSTIGATSPNVGVSIHGGAVVPFPGHTAEDVLLGMSAGFSIAMPLAGANASFSINSSGYIWTTGGGFGLFPTASITWTRKDSGDWIKDARKGYEREHPVETKPNVDLEDREDQTTMRSASAEHVEAPPSRPAPDRIAPPHAAAVPAAQVREPVMCETSTW